jgi:dolichyl-phosphate-mannose--protein O-mannosyl transferase
MMAVESLAVTEPFFDLYERNPHAIKSLFHVIQAGFISILGYSIFTVRLISLIFGCLCLYVFYKTLRQLAVADWFSFLTVVILSVNVQFIYASHFARQEIVILFLMLAVFLMLLKFLETLNLRFVIFAAVLTGLSIGIHPNSFVIGMASLVFLSCNIVIRRLKPAALFVYTGVLSIFAAFFVGLSLYFDPNFFTNYAHYGHSHFDVLAPFSEKFLEMRSYFSKLYFGVSGTYYTPDIRFEFVLFGLLLTLSLFAGYKRPDIQNVC